MRLLLPLLLLAGCAHVDPCTFPKVRAQKAVINVAPAHVCGCSELPDGKALVNFCEDSGGST